eukprot:1160703-Pelagomonas_calceolata.AAC.11
MLSIDMWPAPVQTATLAWVGMVCAARLVKGDHHVSQRDQQSRWKGTCFCKGKPSQCDSNG